MSAPQTTTDNYNELCRLCASYDANKLDIFSDGGKQRNLIGKITSCLSFEVSKDDQYPKSLCFRCIYNLENFDDFRRGCIDARAKLEKAVKQLQRLKFQENRLRDLPEITIEHKVVKKEPEYVSYEEEPEPPNPADFLEACLGDSPQTNNQLNKLAVDDEEGPFPCKVCGRLFNSKSSLTIHAKYHQDKTRDVESSEPYSCYVCEKVFSSKGHLALHSRVHIGETGPATPPVRPVPSQIKLYRCDLCNKSYSMAKHLWGHVSTAHKGDPLVTCSLCLRTFSSISNLEDHKRIKHKNGVEQGDQQPQQQETGAKGQKLVEDGPLDLTQEKQRNDEEYKPRKVERQSSGGSYHSDGGGGGGGAGGQDMDVDEVANESLVYSCLLCGLKFDSTPVLSDHLINEHNYYEPIDFESLRRQFGEGEFPENMMEAETVFCCEICYREFNDRASLWLHMLYSHRDEASKACGICLKVCNDNETLTQHVESCHPRAKTEQRRYSCQVCARQHDSRKKLVTHARIHKLADLEGNLVDPETIVVLNSDFYGDAQPPQAPNNGDGFLSSCDICFKVFENETKLSKHKRSTHKDGLNNSSSNNYHFYFACELCGLSHLSRSERWKHMASAHSGDPAVTCELKSCGKVFPTSAIKKEHAATHHAAQGEYPNTCEVCGKMWKTRVEYWKHMMGVHAESLPFICGVCLKVFCDLTGLVGHVRERHWPLVGGDFCCDVCGRPYSKVSKMSRHRKIHFSVDAPPELKELLSHPKPENERHFLQNHTVVLTCDLCLGPDTKVEYENIESLGKHRHDVHNVMPCDLCTKYYGRTSHLWKHVNKIHKGHPDITCPVCQRTSASRGHLATHIGKHHRSEEMSTGGGYREENGSHECTKCTKIFRKASLMRKHFKHCKGPRTPSLSLPAPVNGVYTCERCPKTFIAQNLLNKHMRSSHVTFKCEICDVKSNTKTELFNHISSEHENHPDVRCAVSGCDKLLRCRADLDRHQRDHRSSAQLHICKFCAEIVTSKVKLKMHLKAQHAKDSRHLCALCLKALPDFDQLKLHIADQHGAVLERANTCPVCAKPCSSRSKLMDHVRNHGAEFHPCKLCLKIFPTKDELDVHFNNHPASDDDDDDDDDDVEMDLDASSINDIIGAPPEAVDKVDSLDAKSIRDIIGAAQGPVKLNRVPESDKEDDSPPAKRPKTTSNCPKCPQTFPNKTQLKEHILRSHKENSGRTSIGFLHQLGLIPDVEKKRTREVRRVFDDDFTPSPCELCDKVWPAKRHLWQHLIRFHKTEAGTCCGVCLKMCSTYTNLSVHLAVHHKRNFDGDGTNLSCKVCGKYHNGRSKLLNHALIHCGQEERANDMVHHCLVCKSVFPLFPSFIDHLQKVHNLATEGGGGGCEKNEEPPSTTRAPFLSCDVCSLVFASEVGLASHKRTHEHSDRFKCGQCGEFFNSSEDLLSHKSAKHTSDEFVCADCKTNFKSYADLTLHNKTCGKSRKAAVETDDDDEDELESDDLHDTTHLEEDSSDSDKSDDEATSSLSDDDDDDDDDDEEEEVENDIEEDVEEEEESADEEPTDSDDAKSVNSDHVKEPKEIRAIEAYVGDNMDDNMVEVVKIDLSDDIDEAIKAS